MFRVLGLPAPLLWSIIMALLTVTITLLLLEFWHERQAAES